MGCEITTHLDIFFVVHKLTLTSCSPAELVSVSFDFVKIKRGVKRISKAVKKTGTILST
jgi:hypothetical protein